MDTKQPRILFLIANARFSGYEIRYIKLCYYLFENGYDARLLVNQNILKETSIGPVGKLLGNKDFASRVESVSMTDSKLIQKINKRLLKRDLFLISSKAKIRDIQPDVIITNRKAKSLKVLKQMLPSVRIVKDITSPDVCDRFFRDREYVHVDQIDTINFVSDSVEKRFQKHVESMGLSIQKRCAKAPIPFYYPIGIGDVDLSAKENKMVFAHRLLKRKNPVLFAQMVNRLCEDPAFDTWSFCLFGFGEMADEVERLLAARVDEGRVEIGYREDIIPYLMRSKIFFSLIEPDSYPSQSVMEAMSCGNALVLMDRGNSRFFLDGNGILVENDLDSLVASVGDLVKDDLEALGRRSLEVVDERLGRQKYLDYMKDLVHGFS
jgi:glycosyltransferase involved in cell wall biosynthesis